MLNRRDFLKAAAFFALVPSGCTGSKTSRRKTVSESGAYVITEPCIDEKDRACVEVCPVDCIYEVTDTELREGDEAYRNMLYIHPEECIDCGACEHECPVEAIYPADEVPVKWNKYALYNALAFVKK